MAVLFNCSYARAAIKSHVWDLMSGNTISTDARALGQTEKKNQELFSFTNAGVKVYPGLNGLNLCWPQRQGPFCKILSIFVGPLQKLSLGNQQKVGLPRPLQTSKMAQP